MASLDRYKALPERVRVVVNQVAAYRGLEPLALMRKYPTTLARKCRWEVWAILYRPGPTSVSCPRLADLWDVDPTTVAYGIRRHNGLPPKWQLTHPNAKKNATHRTWLPLKSFTPATLGEDHGSNTGSSHADG